MGLDQVWLARDSFEDEFEQIANHRKFNALEGFMQNEWYLLGNEGDFNCELLPVNEILLKRLEERIKSDDLNPTSGFFFGSTEKDDYYYGNVADLDKNVLPEVKKRLNQGQQVFYSSWW
jgi:hypothetical protein